MKKEARLTDFQVFAQSTGLGVDQRAINEVLFATYEPVRLWLKENPIDAPFRKLAVSLADEASSSRWHGNVAVAAQICEVTEAVDLTALRRSAGDHRWVLGVIGHSLACVRRSTGWQSEDLAAVVATLSARISPLVHVFADLSQIDEVHGTQCVLWLSAKPGETQIGARLGERDVVLLSKPGPLYLEDSFPVARSAIKGHEYLLFDKAGKVLASVPIDKNAGAVISAG